MFNETAAWSRIPHEKLIVAELDNKFHPLVFYATT